MLKWYNFTNTIISGVSLPHYLTLFMFASLGGRDKRHVPGQ